MGTICTDRKKNHVACSPPGNKRQPSLANLEKSCARLVRGPVARGQTRGLIVHRAISSGRFSRSNKRRD